METAPGRNFLLVTGILYIVFGGIAVLLAAYILIMLAIAVSFVEDTMPWASTLIFYGITALLWALYQIIIGIMGITHRLRPEKAAMLKVFGITDIVLIVLSPVFTWLMFASMFEGYSEYFAVMAPLILIFGFLTLVFRLPPLILYIVGAQKNLAVHRNQINTN